MTSAGHASTCCGGQSHHARVDGELGPLDCLGAAWVVEEGVFAPLDWQHVVRDVGKPDEKGVHTYDLYERSKGPAAGRQGLVSGGCHPAAGCLGPGPSQPSHPTLNFRIVPVHDGLLLASLELLHCPISSRCLLTSYFLPLYLSGSRT